ncbi:hypothetical protein ACOSQ4_023299 [Xanthoceras sorbifolium]
MNSVVDVSGGGGARGSGCVDVYDPVKVKRLQEWAESDAKFLKRLCMKKKEEDDHDLMKKKSEEKEEEGFFSCLIVSTERSESLDRFACRQRYLRSYTFGKEKREEKSKFQIIKKIIINQLLLKNKKKKKNIREYSVVRQFLALLIQIIKVGSFTSCI